MEEEGDGEEEEGEEEGGVEGGEEREEGETVDQDTRWKHECVNVGEPNDTCNILQMDGNDTVASFVSSDNESESDSEVDEMNSSSDEKSSDISSETDPDTEGEPEDDDGSMTEHDEELIPVIVGNRPAPLVPEAREHVRKTVNRNNKLVDALSAPKRTLYNVRSAWSKWTK